MIIDVESRSLLVTAAPRCGSTSMSGYFNIETSEARLNQPDDSLVCFPNPERKYNVIVLRNPYSWLKSGIRYTNSLSQAQINTIGVTKEEMVHSHSGFNAYKFIRNKHYFYNHYYIDFLKLSQYIPVHKDTVAFHVDDTTYLDEFKPWKSEQEMASDYENYLWLKDQIREMPVNVWKILTKGVSKSDCVAVRMK